MIVENNPGNGANVFMALILRAVLVAASVVGFFMWDNYKIGGGKAPSSISVTVKGK
jgi:hypothetical protein